MGYLFDKAMAKRGQGRIGRVIQETRAGEVFECICYAVCQEFNIEKDQLFERRRDIFTAEARQVAMYLTR